MKGGGAVLAGALALAGCASGPAPLIGMPGAADAPPMAARPDPASQAHRPLWHYTPPAGWMNDPNGLIHAGGVWHLYFQYYPHDSVWGPMHWGHATSPDLVRWTTRPIALAPGPEGYIFSGSAVRDGDDIAALYTVHDPVKAKAKTHDHESPAIAISRDGGLSFTKIAGNPVLPNPGGLFDFRDPSLVRDAARAQWVMALAVGDHVRFYGSADLRSWRHLSDFGPGMGATGGVVECPNLFPLIDRASGRQRWVLLQSLNPGGPQGGSGTQYFVGDWDGARFTIDPAFAARIARDGPAWVDAGPDNYAGVTWNDAPRAPGADSAASRAVFIGWMSNWLYAQKVPTQGWRSAMTAPRELALDGLDLVQQPAAELAALRGGAVHLPQAGGALHAPAGLLPAAELDLDFALPQTGDSFTVTLANSRGERLALGLDTQGRWFIDRRQAGAAGFEPGFAAIHRTPRKRGGGQARVRLLFDRGSVELFADGGATAMTSTFFPGEDFAKLSIAWTGAARLNRATAWPLAPTKDVIQ